MLFQSSGKDQFGPLQIASPETSMPTTYPSTRTAYKSILDKTFISPSNENKVLNYRFTKENIHDVYLLPFLVTAISLQFVSRWPCR